MSAAAHNSDAVLPIPITTLKSARRFDEGQCVSLKAAGWNVSRKLELTTARTKGDLCEKGEVFQLRWKRLFETRVPRPQTPEYGAVVSEMPFIFEPSEGRSVGVVVWAYTCRRPVSSGSLGL